MITMPMDLRANPLVERAKPAGPRRLLPERRVIRDLTGSSYEIGSFLRADGDGRSQFYEASDGRGRSMTVRVTPASGGSAAAAVKRMLDDRSADSHILPVTGFWYGKAPETDTRCFFEVFPSCWKPCRQDFRNDPERLRRIVLALNEAIHELHGHRLLHLDVCPENVYEYNGTVALGGFACAVGLADDGNAFAEQGVGRPGYRAPEVGNGYAYTLSDYFSLGCTAAALYQGAHPYQTLLSQAGSVSELNRSIAESGLPLPSGTPEDLQVLCNALTHPQYDRRPGYGVLRSEWYPRPERFCENNKDTRTSSFICVYAGKKYNSPKVLTLALRDDWDKGRDEFFAQGEKNNAFLSAMMRAGSLNHEDVRKLLREYGADKERYDKDLGFAKFLHFLNTDENKRSRCPIYWRSAIFSSAAEDVARGMLARRERDELREELLCSGFLSWKQKNTAGYAEGDRRTLIRQVGQIEAMAKEHPAAAYWWFMYQFAPEEELAKWAPRDDDAVFQAVCGDPNGFYAGVFRMLSGGRLLGRLLSLGRRAEVERLLKKTLRRDLLADVPAGQYWLDAEDRLGSVHYSMDDAWEVYGLFDRICQDKSAVRKHCLHYGPLSPIVWLQQHLDMYHIDDSEARRAAEMIRSARLSDLAGASVSDQRTRLTKLKPAYENFLRRLRDSSQYPVLAFYLREDAHAGSFPRYPGAQPVSSDLFGMWVPAGYLDYLTASWRAERGEGAK